MIVDTSVLAAILFREPEGSAFLTLLAREPLLSMSAGNWLELTTVLARRGHRELLDPAERMLANFEIRIAAVTVEQIEQARAAYLRFGKGQHRARLNFGDCFAYALARTTGESLLFKGDDFTHTDVRRAI